MTESFVDATTLWDLVERRAAATPDTVLLIDEAGRTLTCREFRDRAERVAAGFAAIGHAAECAPGRAPAVLWRQGGGLVDVASEPAFAPFEHFPRKP